MLVPMMMPAIYTSALIFGPAFVIVLAVCLGLLIRLPSLRSWIGGAMVVFALIEFSLVPVWVLWVFTIGIVTFVAGAVATAYGLLGGKESLGIPTLSDREGAGIGLIAVVIGLFIILLFWYSVWGFVLGLGMFTFGVAGAAALLPEQHRAKIGFAILAAGIVVILSAIFTGFLALAFFVGLVVVFAGISVGVSGLPYLVKKRSGGNLVGSLKRVLYVFLAVVIFSSALVFSLRTTRALREELYDDWRYETAADMTVRGVITGIYLNHEVNIYDYSYHIFPALIIVNVTDVVKAEESWSWANLTEAKEYWMNQNMTIGYDKPDVPSLFVGQWVEASGYFDMPIEDSWSYSHKLVITMEIDDSYIKPL